MVKSMTGYGRGSFAVGDESFTVEVKTLNHRHLEIGWRAPERFFGLEMKAREEIKRRFSRGSFMVLVSADVAESAPFRLNLQAARAYVEAAETLKRELNVGGAVDAPLLMKLKDVFTPTRGSVDFDSAWASLSAGLGAALGQVEDWRVKEGETLEADMLGRLGEIASLLKNIEARAPEAVAAYRQKLKEEMARLVGAAATEERVAAEAAIYAERSDISEEITRLGGHVRMFRECLTADGPAGKRLDFLCQELFRETNTIASKSADPEITRTAVEIKTVIERIREQVQNVE